MKRVSRRLSNSAVAFSMAALLGSSAVVCRTAHADTAAYHLLKKIPLTGAEGWDYLSLDAKARRLYISRSTHVTVIDADSGQIVGDVPNTSGVHGIAIDSAGGRGFTSNGRSNSVTIFDLKTLKKVGETTVGEGPDAILFEPYSRRVFTFNGRAQSITALDASTGFVIGTIALPGRPEFAATDGHGEIYDNIEDKSEIVAINAETLKIDHIWPIAPGDGPSGLTIDAKNHRLFAVCDNQKMIVLNTDNGQVVASPTIGNGPDATNYDPKKRLVFSPNGRDGTLTIFHQTDPDHYALVGTIPTQTGARTMTLDSKTHHVFTIAAQFLPAVPGAEQPWRRQLVDGTVTVLEYGQK